MAPEKRTDFTGVLVEYQGYTCGTAFSWESVTGVEPSRGYVTIPVRDFKKWEIREKVSGLEGQTSSRGSQEGFSSSGTLRFVERDPRGVLHEVVYEDILITEDGVETTGKDNDPEQALARVHLADPRYLYGRRGYITEDGAVNVLRQGFGQGADADRDAVARALGPEPPKEVEGLTVLQDFLTTGEGAREIKARGGTFGAGQTTAGLVLEDLIDKAIRKGDFGPISQAFGDKIKETIDTGTIPELLALISSEIGAAQKRQDDAQEARNASANVVFFGWSMWGGIKPKTLREVLERTVLPRLPFSPTLRRLPKDVENELPLNHIWDSILAKQALQDLLDEFRLVLCRNPDGTLSFYHEGEGGLEADAHSFDGQPFDVSDAHVYENGEIAEAKKIVANHWTPPVVIVKGAHVHMTGMALLEPCGELHGRVVPLTEFLAGIGLGDDMARRFVFLRQEQRQALGISYEGIEQFAKCAFKWFRMPPNENDAKGESHPDDRFLPIMDRGLVDAAGQTFAPRVFSERAVPASLAFLKKLKGKDHVRKKLEDTVDAARALILQKDADAAAKAKAAAEKLAKRAEGGATGSRKKVVTGEDAEEAEQLRLQDESARLEEEKIEAHKRAIEALAGVGNFAALINLSFGEVESGFTIDRERGIVMFATVQGHVDPEGSSIEVAELVRRDAKVVLEFGFVKHAGGDSPVTIADRYFSVWQREVTGETVKVKQLEAVPVAGEAIASAGAAMIDRPDLLQVVALDGTTNKKRLDEIAGKIALARMQRPSSTLGGEFKFGRPIQLINTGRCQWISYGLESDGSPVVRARLDAEAPIPPRPDFTTFAQPRKGDGKLHQNVNAPRSTRKDGP